MRKMRKFIALAITAIMIIATGIVGFAAGGTANLTVNLIKPLEEGESVEVYPIKLMDLNIEGEEYKYTINSTYREAIKGSLESTVTEDTQIISELRTMENNGKEAKNFSKKLKDKIVANEEELNKNIKSTITSKGQQGVTFNNLEYGYYIVIAKGKTEYQTALVVLDGKVTNGTPGNTATGGNETIVLKGEELIITKKADKDSAEIGEKVNYTVETEVPAEGTTNFVLTDTLSKGLSYVKENNIVKLNIKIYNDNTEKKSVEREASVSVVGNENLESINIDLNEFVAGKQIDNYTIAEGDKIVITYSAKVNKNAVIVNTNTVKYGNETDVTAIVNTYPLQIKKVDGKTGELLSGAKFKLCKDSEGKDIVNLTGENGIYRLLEAGEAGSSTTEVVSQASNLTGKDFNIYINGLRAGTYWLVETEAPEGYNKAEPIKIVITRTGSGENEWKVSADGLENNDNNKIVRIENNKGGLLPETGGMGTILFTIAGLTLILIAVFGMRKRKEEN